MPPIPGKEIKMVDILGILGILLALIESIVSIILKIDTKIDFLLLRSAIVIFSLQNIIRVIFNQLDYKNILLITKNMEKTITAELSEIKKMRKKCNDGENQNSSDAGRE